MTDIETVVNGLNDIGGFIAGRIGFEQARNFLRTIDDAIDLLKEQEKPNGKCVNECECWDSAYERGKQDALKEQEPVEPILDIFLHKRCPSCKTLLKGRFCRECGKAVKWND